MVTFKFGDDVTFTELIDQSNISRMQLATDQIADWSHRNFMNNTTKQTKEILFCLITENPPPQVTFNTGAVDRVTSFKLLGLIIMHNLTRDMHNLSRDNHVNTVCAKAGTCLYFLKLRKRSSVTFDDLLHYHKTIIRPVKNG